jgi:probable HAF family extracellular repeat protein
VAEGVNASREVVGAVSTFVGAIHAFFRCDGGTVYDRGTLGGTQSSAPPINAFGQVVGESRLADGNVHAFLYQHGTMQDLNSLIPPDSRCTLFVAAGSNDSGRIVGWGFNAAGAEHAFMLTPVPAPANALLVGLGIAAIVVRLATSRRQPISESGARPVMVPCPYADQRLPSGTPLPWRRAAGRTMSTRPGVVILIFLAHARPVGAKSVPRGIGGHEEVRGRPWPAHAPRGASGAGRGLRIRRS